MLQSLELIVISMFVRTGKIYNYIYSLLRSVHVLPGKNSWHVDFSFDQIFHLLEPLLLMNEIQIVLSSVTSRKTRKTLVLVPY